MLGNTEDHIFNGIMNNEAEPKCLHTKLGETTTNTISF